MPNFKQGMSLANDAFGRIGRRRIGGQVATEAQRIVSGRRRAASAGIGLGIALGANRMMGPRPRSSGGRGYQYPRSSGGYA